MVSRTATRKRKAAAPILDDPQPSKRTKQSSEQQPAPAEARRDPASASAPDDPAEDKSRVLYIG